MSPPERQKSFPKKQRERAKISGGRKNFDDCYLSAKNRTDFLDRALKIQSFILGEEQKKQKFESNLDNWLFVY